jgi:hypothetical protein
MTRNDPGLSLHDRATRGERLDPAEVEQLEAWYTDQDGAEAQTLDWTASPASLDALQSQVDAALGQLTVVSRRIQRIARENDALRRDIADLRRQIARRELLQPA